MVFIIFSISHNKFPCPVNIKAKVRFKSDVKLMHHLKQKNMETRKLKILLSPAMMFSISSHEKQWRIFKSPCISQFSRSVMSDSLRPHESQYARPPGVHSNSCHPSISSSVVPFSSCPQSLPASGSLPMSRLFASGGQGIMKWSALVLNFINPHIAYLPSIPYLYSHQHEDKPSLPITFVYIWHGTTGLVQGACTSG